MSIFSDARPEERDFLAACLGTVEGLLGDLTPSDFVERWPLEGHRDELRAQLARIDARAATQEEGENMPGPVSDSYDPEWGTATERENIHEALSEVYERVSAILGDSPPLHILALVRRDLPAPIPATLTEREWRLLRFACERARESL